MKMFGIMELETTFGGCRFAIGRQKNGKRSIHPRFSEV
jgi:hypothetical protein